MQQPLQRRLYGGHGSLLISQQFQLLVTEPTSRFGFQKIDKKCCIAIRIAKVFDALVLVIGNANDYRPGCSFLFQRSHALGRGCYAKK
ncbi:MAG: hypothetical protein IPN33_02040 [Saprospiraceae bacterium]|nr:hypothetical protein [Saprospiraceae bacterium]